jgi:hypothetical protein
MKKKPNTKILLCKMLNQFFLLIHVNRNHYLPKINKFWKIYWVINRYIIFPCCFCGACKSVLKRV